MSSYRATLTTLRRALDAAGASLPKPVMKALAESDTITEGAAAITVPTTEELGDAVAAVILDGRDPADDPAVIRLTTLRNLTGEGGRIAGIARAAAERRTRTALTANHAEVSDALTAAAAAAGDRLTAAHDVLGDVDLAESERIMKMGPDAVRAWADACEVLALLDVVDRGVIALAGLTGSDHSIIGAGSTLRLAHADLEMWEQAGRRADAWTIVSAGKRIDLADRTTITQRQAELTKQREARAEAREQEQRRARR